MDNRAKNAGAIAVILGSVLAGAKAIHKPFRAARGPATHSSGMVRGFQGATSHAPGMIRGGENAFEHSPGTFRSTENAFGHSSLWTHGSQRPVMYPQDFGPQFQVPKGRSPGFVRDAERAAAEQKKPFREE